jgi:hypothetical protein
VRRIRPAARDRGRDNTRAHRQAEPAARTRGRGAMGVERGRVCREAGI